MDKVILVNHKDEMIGTAEKLKAHQQALLHRALSIFIFNEKGEMLLQQRAFDKYHSGGLWTNACCTHPKPNEDVLFAAHRRLKEEMGFDTSLTKIFSFTYKAVFDNGLTEHEFDHVFLGTYSGSIKPDPIEVANYSYLTLNEIEQQLKQAPDKFTNWFQIAFPRIKKSFGFRKPSNIINKQESLQ